jgi:hypothetical protein
MALGALAVTQASSYTCWASYARGVHKPSLGNFEAASTDRETTRWWLIANWRAVDILPYLLENPHGLSCRKPLLLAWSDVVVPSTPHTLADRTQHVRNCAGSSRISIKDFEQNTEGPCCRCVGYRDQRDQSFGWCALSTAIEHTVGDEAPPLAVGPAEV